VTYTVPSLPPVALSLEPLPSVSVSKAQPVVPPPVVNPFTPPVPVVLVKQFQPPKPYSGASSWKGYREYFERLAAVNGWPTTEQKTEQLALALEGPASEVLRDLDTSQPQAYSLIWKALGRRFGSLGGAREAMHRFDSRRQEENETIPDFEQALRTLHRKAWPAATPEQRDAAMKRRFEDGMISTEMIQFLRLHARDLDFHATVIKARQFADATGQSRTKKRVNFIDTRPKSPVHPEWEPLLQGFQEMMAEALQPLQRALRSQTQGNDPLSTASTPPQSRLPRHSSTRRREGHDRTSSRATLKGSGEAIPTSPAVRVVDSFSRRVKTITTTDRRHHRTLRTVNNRSSNVLPPRQRLVVHAAVQFVSTAVNGVVTRRSTGAMIVLYHRVTVVHRLLGIISATSKPPLA